MVNHVLDGLIALVIAAFIVLGVLVASAHVRLWWWRRHQRGGR